MVHIYTGGGKGKTTAAVGLATRAAKDHKVLFVQLLKDGTSSEVEALSGHPNITYKYFGTGQWVLPGKDNKKQKAEIQKSFNWIKIQKDEYDVVVVDEGVSVLGLGLATEEEIVSLIDSFQKDKELILTGQGANQALIDKADLVTEMKRGRGSSYEKNNRVSK
jgi:cob(I)alamin adenosyltransferase